MTTKDAIVRARISPDIKQSAELILTKLGLNTSQAINLFFSKIIANRGIPFSLNLEDEDIPENYTKITDENNLKSIIGLE
ncbi:type II toxin-antitoxin system RelB/DinJ family antitoxin [Candidatus Gracilibacteria bacterium]|nr:type II toxin-antitoxin system RelB/DinJ family antitoxin [Candidatus Gracilibacteria bacterium]